MIVTGCDSSIKHNAAMIAEPDEVVFNSLDGDQNIKSTETVENVTAEIKISHENIWLEYNGEDQKMHCFAIGHQDVYLNTIKNAISKLKFIILFGRKRQPILLEKNTNGSSGNH